MGTPPPLPRGAFVSLPLAWNVVLSLPLEDKSETEAEPPEDCGARLARISLEPFVWCVFSRGRPLLSFVPPLRDVARLVLLETVIDRETPFLGSLRLGVGRQSANASWDSS